MHKFLVKTNDEGRTILKFLERHLLNVPKSKIEKIFRQKNVELNFQKTNNKKLILKKDDVVVVKNVYFKKIVKKTYVTSKNFDLVYEDEDLLIISKHPNIAMDLLNQQVKNFLKFQPKDTFTPASVGRLDKVTSGLIIYAKNYASLRELQKRQNMFKKIYIFKSGLREDIITEFCIRHNEKQKKEICGNIGKTTKTIFYRQNNENFAHLITGRKHQIRASLAKLGYPIYGDVKYGGTKDKRVYLHSFAIQFQGLKTICKQLEGKIFKQRPIIW